MNPLTNVKNITKLNEIELAKGLVDKKSWHDIYKDSAWIFIGGLAYGLTEGDILAVFSQYGEIVNINLVRDKKTGKTKGFCFLCYANQKSTILAVDNFNAIKLCGRTIRVDHVSNYKPPKDNELDDELTKQLKAEGCAPKSIQPEKAEAEEAPEIIKKKKKVKKEKKKHKKSKKKEEKSIHKKVKVKKEKHDPGYDKYENSHKNQKHEAALKKSQRVSSSDEDSSTDSSDTQDKNHRSDRNFEKQTRKDHDLPGTSGYKIKKEPHDSANNSSNSDSDEEYERKIKHKHKTSYDKQSDFHHKIRPSNLLSLSKKGPHISRHNVLFLDKIKSDLSGIRDKDQKYSASPSHSYRHDSENTNKRPRHDSSSSGGSPPRTIAPHLDRDSSKNHSKYKNSYVPQDKNGKYSHEESRQHSKNNVSYQRSQSPERNARYSKTDYKEDSRKHSRNNECYRKRSCSPERKGHYSKTDHKEESRQHSRIEESYQRRSRSPERHSHYSKTDHKEENRRDKERRERDR